MKKIGFAILFVFIAGLVHAGNWDSFGSWDATSSSRSKSIVLPISSSTGVVAMAYVTQNITLTGWEIVSTSSGSAVVDLWKSDYDNFPPTVANTFAGSEKPTLTTEIKNADNSLTSMTTELNAGEYIFVNVESTDITSGMVVLKGVLR